MSKYELSIIILENGVAVDHKMVSTWAENLDRAQRNIAWRMVVKDNPEAEYPGLAICFEDGRVIDGGKRVKAVPLYIVLMHDLHKQEVYVDEVYAKQLRQKYAVNKNNYVEKLTQIIKDFKAEETAKAESANAQKNKEEDKAMKEIFRILEEVDADIVGDGKEWAVGPKDGAVISISGTKPIEIGRSLYECCGQVFNKADAEFIRKELVKLFGNNKAKQEIPPDATSESVKNNLTDDEESLVSEGIVSKTVNIIFDVQLPDGQTTKVARRISIRGNETDPDFLYGYVYRNGEYVGYWQWNRKHHSSPVYKPKAMKKTWLGQRNIERLCAAIKKAVCGK